MRRFQIEVGIVLIDIYIKLIKNTYNSVYNEIIETLNTFEYEEDIKNSLTQKFIENEGNISFWAKSVGEKVSKIIEAEHKILQELKGGLYNLMEQNSIMDNFQNNDQIKVQYSILSLTDNNKEMTILSSLGCFCNSEMESTRKEFIKHLH